MNRAYYMYLLPSIWLPQRRTKYTNAAYHVMWHLLEEEEERATYTALLCHCAMSMLGDATMFSD